MKARFAAGMIAAFFLLALGALALGRPVNRGGEVSGKWARKNYAPGEVLVKFRSGTDEWDRDQARRGIRAGRHRQLGRIGVEKMKLPPGMSVEEAVRALENDPRVEYAEPNRRVVYLGMPIQLPDDPAFANSQWYLNKASIAGYVGTRLFFVDVDIDAPEAWGVMGSTFDPAMTAGVGVLDSGDGSAGFFSDSVGYLPNHEDLLNSLLFVNTGELPPSTTTDNDSNGHSNDVNGWDFMGNDNAPADTPVDIKAPYHGTKISGIIAAAWGNSTGIAGIGMEALRVLPLKGDDNTVAQYIDAIGYAAALADTGENVRVLNASWAITPQGVDSQALREAVQNAGTSGLIFVAAAGNVNTDLPDFNNDRLPVYPASYATSLSNVLSVAATDSTGNLADFSHFGPASVQIAAPGKSIYTTSGGSGSSSGYAYASGTSFAAPIAAAALGLIMAADGPGTIPSVAISRLIKGGDFDARLAGVVKSGKRVNLAGALAPFHPYSGLAPLGATQPIAMYSDSIGARYATFISAVSSDPTVAVLTVSAGAGWAVSPVSPGIATFTLSFTNASDPVASWETGPWRVTGVAPFTDNLTVGDTVAFTSLIALAGTPAWSMADTSSVGSIDPLTGVFTALAEGRTRVSLSIDGSPADTSGMITVMNPAPSGGGGGVGCFIATAAFGSYEAPAVKVLRDYRDADLLTNGPGKWFVAMYYRYSPPAAQWLDDHPWLKPIVRVLLFPLIGFAWVSLKVGPVWAALLLALLLTPALFHLRFQLRRDERA